jgi:hypothetical protein
MPDGSTFQTTQRPQFSTLSAPNGMGYGADWPEWQRNLYPVTYERQEAVVRAALNECREGVAMQRRLIGRLLKSNSHAAVRMARRRLDDLNRYVRNCEAQLRLIAATDAYFAAKMARAA